jgi:hypothetical protein
LKGKLTNKGIRWYGHFLRMNEKKILKKVLNKKIKRKTPKRTTEIKMGTTG